MASAKMPKSVPCKFDNGCGGTCGSPSDKGFCEDHEDLPCGLCGEQAERFCEDDGVQSSRVCGLPLCATCTHEHPVPRPVK